MNPFEFWPDSEEQHSWISTTITDASATFQIEPRDAIVYAFKLLADETTLHRESLKAVRKRINGTTSG